MVHSAVQMGYYTPHLKKQANILNNQFASVFNEKEDTPLKQVTPNYPLMPDINIQENGVAKLLRCIKAHKATGPDEIPAQLLKLTADQLAPIITTIFKASCSQGAVPSAWQKANVIPLFKQGDHADAAHYPPVSRTSICCKAMEHILQSQMMRHLDFHNILSQVSDSQHSPKSSAGSMALATTV